MPAINPYLIFDENAEEAFTFYQSLFGGDFIGGISRFKDAPEGNELPEREKNKVMHISLSIGDSNMLMASDSPESASQKVTIGNNIYLSITTDSKEQADHYFDGLSEGGEIEMEMQDTFWGDYFGMLTDKFGIKWMISFNDSK